MRLYSPFTISNNSTGKPFPPNHAPTQLSSTLRLTATAVLVGLLPSIISAQVRPLVTSSMGYATVGESTFYVHGGFTYRAQSQVTGPPDALTNQMFALDLTVAWNSARAAWRNVSANNSLTIAWHSLSVSKDQQQLFLWDSPSGGAFSIFDNQTASWTPSTPVSNGRKANGLQSAVNQDTGVVIVPSALYNGMQTFETVLPITATSSYTNNTMLTEIAGLTHYTFVWSVRHSAMLLYGGHSNNNQPNPVLRLFGNGQWSNLVKSQSVCFLPDLVPLLPLHVITQGSVDTRKKADTDCVFTPREYLFFSFLSS